jgi:seryl-tRNA synthetase
MLDRRFIRENPEAVKAAVRVKGIDLDVDELLSLDQSSRELQRELDEAQTRRKAFAKEFAKADEEARAKLKAEHEELDQQLKGIRDQLGEGQRRLQALLLLTPTIPWTGSPVGPDETANVVDQGVGEPPGLRLRDLDHVELLESAAGRLRPGAQGGGRAGLRADRGGCCWSARCCPTRSTC